MHPRSLLLAVALLLAASPSMASKRALFDNAHAETAGNADWEIDTHQPTPSPDQSGIGANTPGTYWVGAISSWGVDLVKRGYTVTTNTSALTYGNSSNPYDLANYDVLIIDEPNTLFTSAEATAILNYVRDGGGLVAISDHSGSDRNNDGSDSPMIWNALDPTHLLGVHFGVSGDANNNITQTSTNVNASPSDSVTVGPIGTVTGLAFHNGTTMTLYPSVNPSVRGEVWMNGLSQTSATGLMAASSVYGNGRIVFACDSSPADDGSATSGNTNIFDGWGETGATDSTLFLNATLWVNRRATGTDLTPPVVTLTAPHGAEDWKAGSTHAITWSASDNVGVTRVDLAYSTNGGASFPNTIATGLTNSGSYTWTVPNAPSTTARVRVTARDAAGNLAADSSAANFTIDLWTLTASAGSGGSVVPSGAIGVAQGASQHFSIAPSAGEHVASLTVDGGSVTPDTTYTFTNVTANHTLVAAFALNTYTIAASAGANGGISPSGSVVVSYGGSQSFTMTPAGCYHVANVLVDGASVGAVASYTFTNVTASHTIAASFAIDTYAITTSAGTNGAIAPSGGVGVNCGGSPSFTITPARCYHVADVLVDGASVGAPASYTFTNVTANHTIEASFALDAYTITASAGANGTIAPDGGVSVSCGADQSFTLTPDPGYHVADVRVDGGSVGAPASYTFTNVTANHAIEASFALDPYTITASAGANGSIEPSGAVAVDAGASATFTITPAGCYHVADVLVDGQTVGAVGGYTFANVTANHTIEATFELDLETITASAESNGTVEPGGSVSVGCGSDEAFTIAPDTGYHVADVRVDGASVGALASYTFTNVTSGHTLAASFAANLYALTVATVGSGSVTRDPDQPTYPYGTSVRLTALPGAGWAFAGWSGDTTGTGNPTTLTLWGARSVTATFVDVEAPTVQVTAPAGGERWDEGSVETITWTAVDNAGVDSVSVDVSLSGTGGPWLPVASGLANTGTYSWTLPEQSSDSAMVRVTAYDHALNAGSATSDSLFHIVRPVVGVDLADPTGLALARPRPTPSLGSAELRFSLPRAGTARLEILDPSGRRVWVTEGAFSAGSHSRRWDGSSTSGARIGAGIYFVRLTTPWGSRGERLVWLR